MHEVDINTKRVHRSKIIKLILATLVMLSVLTLTIFVRANSAAEALFMLGIPCIEGANGSSTMFCLTETTVFAENDSRFDVTPQVPSSTPSIVSPFLSDKPTILIYHTHTKEAYTSSAAYPYDSGDTYRTDDDSMNIVAVGTALYDELQKLGYNVIHDTTNHEPPKLATAYERSLVTMEKYKTDYPSLQLFIDVHRDASGSAGKTDYCTINGVQTARLMFVVGTGKGASGNGFPEMPDYESNFSLASRITEYLSQTDEKLVRPIRTKTGRYNQHVSDTCLLVEVGHNMNTLEQALAAIPYLCDAIDNALQQRFS